MITLTPTAVKRVKSIIEGENNPAIKLRIFVQGGGCSGMSYGFTLDEEQSDDDFEVDADGVTALVDAASMQYLQGATIDFKETMTSSQFIIANPNATAQCGCGSSFAI